MQQNYTTASLENFDSGYCYLHLFRSTEQPDAELILGRLPTMADLLDLLVHYYGAPELHYYPPIPLKMDINWATNTAHIRPTRGPIEPVHIQHLHTIRVGLEIVSSRADFVLIPFFFFLIYSRFSKWLHYLIPLPYNYPALAWIWLLCRYLLTGHLLTTTKPDNAPNTFWLICKIVALCGVLPHPRAYKWLIPTMILWNSILQTAAVLLGFSCFCSMVDAQLPFFEPDASHYATELQIQYISPLKQAIIDAYNI